MSDETLVDTSADVAAADAPPAEGKYPCPEPGCGHSFETKHARTLHRKNDHDYVPYVKPSAGTRTTGRAGSKGAEINRLRRELKTAVGALCLLPFMAKGTANNLMDPRVLPILSEKQEAFADAWVAVAEQNEQVRRWLLTLLSGGVWINAAAQTAALGYCVAVFANVTPLHPGAAQLIPELIQFMPAQTMEQPSPGETTASNGGVKADPQSS